MEKFFNLFKRNFKTNRLELRILNATPENAEIVWNVIKHENPTDFMYISFSPKYNKPLPESVDEVLSIMKNDDKIATENGVIWYVFYDNKLIGYQRIHFIESNNTLAFSAVWFVKSAWGNGFSKEIHEFLEKIAFEELKVHRTGRQCMGGNMRSKKSIESSGYHLDGCMRDANLMKDGTYMNHLVFTKLENEYKKI